MARRVARQVAAACLLALAVLGAAWLEVDADGPLVVNTSRVDGSEYPVLRTILSVEEGGRPLTTVDLSAVRVTEEGLALDVRGVRAATDAGIPLALVIALDTSGSMQGAALEGSKASAIDLIRHLGAADSVAVVAFSDTVRVLQPLTHDRAAAEAAITGVVAGGNTRLFGGSAEALEIAAAAPERRRAVVILSDGEDFGEGGTIARADTIERAATSGAMVFGIGVGPNADARFLMDLASASGGRYFAATSASIGEVYGALDALVRSQILVEMTTSSALDGQLANVQIEVEALGRTATTSMSYQRPQAASPEAGVSRDTNDVVQATGVAWESRSASWWLGASVLVALVIAGGCGVAVARRRQERPRTGVADDAPLRGPAPDSLRSPAPSLSGRLAVLTGATAGESAFVTATPLLIGPGDHCDLRLPASEAGHARVWLRNGRLMVHWLPSDGSGVGPEWASLGPDQEFVVGGVVLAFRHPEPAV